MAWLLCLFAVLLPPEGPEPSGKAAVREIKLDGLRRPLPMKKWNTPAVLTSVEEVTKAFPEGAARVRILEKEVDLKREKLVFFTWSGSGADRLEHRIEKVKDDGKEVEVVTFSRRPGVTLDITGHFRLFAVPRSMKVRFAEAG